MNRGHDIRAVGVVIPARNEQDLIDACLTSVDKALHGLPSGIATAVWVVVDRSSDATAEIVRRRFAGHADRGYCVNDQNLAIGSVRHHGIRRVLRLLPGHEPAGVWLLHTDADTQVAADWATAQVRHARAHAYAVAGTAGLDTVDRLSPAALRRYEQLLEDGRHRHVYGANLGVRADVYGRVGGFSACRSGEDHDLVRRLRRAGYRVVQAADVRVTTSGRLVGRAEGGLADLLGELNRDADAGGPAHVRSRG